MVMRTIATALVLLVLPACAQFQTRQTELANSDLAGLDMVEGGYARFPRNDMWSEYKGANFPGRWLANAETDVYAEPRINAAVLDRLSPGECVDAVRYELHVRPNRGVVRSAGEGFEVGDVVYVIGGGEDWVELWRRGRSSFVGHFNPVIDYDPIASEGRFVDWVYVERASGQPSGWLRNPMMPGVESPIDDCPSRNDRR